MAMKEPYEVSSLVLFIAIVVMILGGAIYCIVAFS
jgi:hypothetical protein